MPTRNEIETALSQWQTLGTEAIAILDAIANTRISQTMTEHRAAEIMAENNQALRTLSARFQELLNG
jgi:hypothetical protein